MKSLFRLFLFSLALSSSIAMAQFTAGRVVVLQCTNIASGGGGTLVEYNQAGVSTYQVVLPFGTTTADTNSIVFGNNSTLNHNISLSADGAFVVIGGYGNSFAVVDAAAGADSPRVVATVKYNGNYSRPFTSSLVLSTTALRSAASDGYGNFWGNGNTTVRYLNTGADVATVACRAVAIANGNICYTKAPAGAFGVYQVSGTPTTVTAQTLIIPSSPMGASATPGGFAIPANPVVGSIAYLTDYNGSPSAGVGHYHWDGSSWVWDYNLLLAGGEKPQHVAVDYSGANPFVYVTPFAAVANHLYAFNDTSASAAQLTLATAPAGTVFRGVAMAPTQPALPTFTVHPANTTNSYTSTATFGPVSATNANPNGYTWKKGSTTLADGPTGNGSTISGATTTTLTISSIGATDAGTYFSVASNNGGSVTSNPAMLVLAGSSITTQLVSRTNVAGTTATFHVVSGGPAPLSYAWKQGSTPLSDGPSPSGSGATISGSTTNTLTITGVQDADAGSYTVTVTDGSSTESSSVAGLTVVDPPVVIIQPGNQSKIVGSTANFSVTATGGVLSYQWFKGATALTNGPTGLGSTVSGAQSSNLSIASVQVGDAGSYSVTVTNLAGTTNSDPASLTVGSAPTLGVMANSTNLLGSDAVFSTSVGGTPSFTYTWRHNGAVLANDGSHIFGADTASLGITNVTIDDRRLYSLTVSNDYGSATASALLYVIIDTNKPNDVPDLIIYEPFNYPNGPTTAVGFYSWENLISIYNRITGQPAFWFNCGGGLNSGILVNDLSRYDSITRQPPGLYPWPGIDGRAANAWNFASGGNNNHLKFGGVTNGSAYFSCIFHGDQGSAVNNGTFDVIAGFTSGASDASGANADTWNYKLCTMADGAGGDGYHLGVFKGLGATISGASVNGQWASPHLLRGQIHVIVGCYKINSGGTSTNDDVVSLWIDPPLSSFGVAEGNVPSSDAGGMITNWNNNAPITEFGIRAGGNSAPFSKRLTDLRIGKTWASVTHPYFPTLKVVNTSPDVTLSWPAKDSVGSGFEFSSGHYGYQLRTASDVAGPYSFDLNDHNSESGTNKVVIETPGALQFWQLIYPARSGAIGQY